MRRFLFSLRTRALLLVSLAFVVFIGTIVFHATAERRMRLEFVKSHLLDTAKLIAAKHEHVIEYAQQYLEFLIKDQAWSQAGVSGDCQPAFERRLVEIPHVANVYVALPDGMVVCSAISSGAVINVADRPYFKNALASPALVIGEPTTSRISGEERLPFAKAVRDPSGRVIAVFVVSLDLPSIVKGIANSGKYPSGSRIGLIDANGRVLARAPDPDKWVGKDASTTSFFQTVAARNEEGTFEQLGFDGVARVYGLVRFASTSAGPIWLWLGYAEHTVTADIERDFKLTAIVVAGLLLLTFAAVWVGGQRLFLRPIEALSAAARRMGEGDLGVRTGLAHGRDELGKLAQSFDDMEKSLEAKSHDVVLANRAVKVLSRWNRALLMPRDETTLITYMCQAIVEVGGYRSAWVGFARADANKTVEPVAWWGMDSEFVTTMNVTWADEPRGRGPTGIAIRCGTTEVVNDCMTSDATAPWRGNALRRQINSIISIPLKVDGAVIGALSIHSAEAESFGEQEAVLLTEVAAALSSGIAAVRARTERARLEVSLQTTEERFRAAAEASLDALFVFKSVRDGEGNVVDLEIAEMNGRAAQQIGLTRDDAIGKRYLGLLPYYNTAGTLDKYVEVINTGNRFEEEFAYDAAQKGRRWFRQQAVPVGDGIAISLRDITKWKHAGEKIREGEERLRLAMGAAHMGAWSVDLDSDTYTVSEDTGPIFGLPKGAGPRSTPELLELVHPDDREQLANGIKQSRETKQAAQREFRVLWPDGTVHWVESHGSVICDATGKPVRTAGVLLDITQRKLDVIALQRANRALKTLSAANEALVHATDESGLLHQVCRVIVDTGGYALAWVGFIEHDLAKTVRVVAQYGSDEGYLESMNITWADTGPGRGPIGTAIRTGTIQVNQDTRTNPNMAIWRDAAVARGLLSSIAMPLGGPSGPIGALTLYAREPDAFGEDEVRLLKELADDLAFGITTLRTKEERDRIAHAHKHHEAILRKSLEDSIQAIAATVEMRDPYTSGHQKRVAELAVALAQEMGLPEERVHGLHLAGVVHDLGKISVPAEILAKPGKLTPIEYTLIQGHAQAGYEILKDIDFPWPIATIVWQHHERFDGTGYPLGLKGDSVLLESSILAVADVVEAMGSHRPYRATLGIDVALQEIERGRGTKYDPAVADACLKLFREGTYALIT